MMSPNPTPPATPQATAHEAAALDFQAPGIARRLAAFVYEGVVLFGVVMIAGYLYSSLTQQRHALQGQWGLRAFLVLVLAAYFIGFWSKGGQTVAMKAWHVRLVDTQGAPVTQARALARFALAWMWFIPALGMAHFFGLDSSAAIFGLLTVGVLAYAALALLHPQRQFWHDAVCGTRLVNWRPAPRPPKTPPRSEEGSR